MNKNIGVRRTGAHYVASGTTLCHIFWAIFWVPMAVVAVASGLLFMIAALHVKAYEDFSYKYGVAAAFIPEGFVLATVLAAALIVFAIMGADKVGFFKLLWLYLVSLKTRVCPLVSFEQAKNTTL